MNNSENTITITIEADPGLKQENDLLCLLCSIMEALLKPQHILDDYKPEKLSKVFGGDDALIIELGGPESAYNEDKFIDMIKDILPIIQTTKEYSVEDIANIRKDKGKYGASMKKLLAIMDDNHVAKAFKGMQIFKNGGNIEIAKEGMKVKEAISGDLILLPNDVTKEQLDGKKVIKTTKGDVIMQKNGTCIYTHRVTMPKEASISRKQEGGDIKSEEVLKQDTLEISQQAEEKPNLGEQVEVKIGGKTYKLWEAKTLEEKEKGLQGIKDLADDEGMIFYYDGPEHVDFWMKDTPIDLTIAFFSEDEECISVKKGKAESEELIPEDDVMFVVELNINADVTPGDSLDLPGDNEEYVMFVLGSNGEAQMQLFGGERIVSRKETVMLIKKAKRAYNLKNVNDDAYVSKCKSLGKYIFKVLDKLDSRDPDYVQLDKKDDKLS